MTPRRRWVPWVVWGATLIGVVAAFLPLRARLDRIHVAFALLLVVLGGSAMGGRAVGLTLAGLSYVSFHYFFIEHFDSLLMSDPLDAIVLVAFLVTSVVAEHLLSRARDEAEAARQRTAEIERLASLGAETLSAGRAEDALRTITEVIRTTIGVDRCQVAASDADPAGETTESRRLAIPLVARGQRVGVLVLSHAKPIALTAQQRRFLDALSYYAALGVERAHLIADAERADAFRKADALKASLIAGLSHDLRTPLTTIKALANRLGAAGVGGASEASAIEHEADRLNRLVTDLLDLSRLNAGALPARPELNTAADLVGAALARLDASHGGGRVRVTPFDRDDAPPLAGSFDFVQALRALVNIIENALKYSAPPTPVDLSVMARGAQLEFVVADRGPGVPVNEQERIFEPFYRAPGVLPDTGGVGLGLAIARRLAHEQGGTVRYRARDGGGSEFTLALPLTNARLDDATAPH